FVQRPGGFGVAAFGQPCIGAAGAFGAVLHLVEHDAGQVVALALALARAIASRLALGGLLGGAGYVPGALFGVRERALRRRQLGGLALAIMAPVIAIARRAERGHLDDGVHGFEQFAVVADD